MRIDSFLFFVLVINLAGCTLDKFSGSSKVKAPLNTANLELPIAHSREITIGERKVINPVKLFFIIDDSPSMEQFQAKLIQNTKRWIDVIGSDFIGEIHSVTTSELNTSSYIPSITYPELMLDNSVVYRSAAAGIGSRLHEQWGVGYWYSNSGVIGINRTIFAYDEITQVTKPWTALDGKIRNYSLVSKDIYSMLSTSLMGTFTGGANQKAKLEQVLFAAINRGASGSNIEQPYCTTIHALLDSGKLNIFKPEDKVAFIFLQHGEAQLVKGESCIAGFEMKATIAPEALFEVEIYGNGYHGNVQQANDEGGDYRSAGWIQMFHYDCDGSNALCKASPAQLAESKALRKSLPKLNPNWNGLIHEKCTIAEEAAYVSFLHARYPGEFEGAKPKKKYISGECVSYRGYGPYGGIRFNVPSQYLYKSCSDAGINTAMNAAIDKQNQVFPKWNYDTELCYSFYDSPYAIAANKKLYLQGLNENSGVKDYADLLAKFMNEKIGRANYIVTAVTTTGTSTNKDCDPESFKANSLIDLVKGSPSPNELISICEEDYTPALKRIEKFALFEAIRSYVVEPLPKTERLVRLRVLSSNGSSREIPLSRISLNADRTSIQIEKNVEIQPKDKLVLEYRNESPIVTQIFAEKDKNLPVRSKLKLLGSNFYEGIDIHIEGVKCLVESRVDISSLICSLQANLNQGGEIKVKNLDGGESAARVPIEITAEILD